jgi:glycopeptide antibiotics resistance protein
MKKKLTNIIFILIVGFLLLVGATKAQAQDRIITQFDFLPKADTGWMMVSTDKIDADKQIHFVGHMAIGFVSYLIFEPLEFTNEFQAIALSLGTSAAIGFWKEFADKKTTGFDWEDIQFNFMGAIVGVTLSWLLRNRAKKSLGISLNGVQL